MLSETNQDLLTNSSRLNDDVREKLFASDVKIYNTYFDEENQTYSNLNNFQAVNRLVESGLKLSANLGDMNDDQAEWLVRFNLRNSLNDLLLKTQRSMIEMKEVFEGEIFHSHTSR